MTGHPAAETDDFFDEGREVEPPEAAEVWSVTLEAQLLYLAGEQRRCAHIFPSLVARGKLDREKAERQQRWLAAVIETVAIVKNNEEIRRLVKGAIELRRAEGPAA